MTIVTVPAKLLRQQASPITKIDEQLLTTIADMEQTLIHKKNPRGVGLSAPQVNHSLRIFSTYLDHEQNPPQVRTFINPEVITVSPQKTLGDDPSKPILEGCLSIPLLYGPVPRYQWVEYAYQVIEDGQLKTKYETFYDFDARVMQHEYDHLEGKLFTDYSLEFELPLYQDHKGNMKLVDTKIAEKF